MTPQQLIASLGALGQVWPDATSIRAAVGRGLVRSERLTWHRALVNAYGHTALRLAWLICGSGATLSDVQTLAQDLSSWQSRIDECASLAPLLLGHLRIAKFAPESFKPLRDSLLRRGLTPAAWKWMCRQPRGVVRKLTALGWSHETVYWVNLLSAARPQGQLDSRWLESGRPYMTGLAFKRLCAGSTNPDHESTVLLQRLMRLLPARADPESVHNYEMFVSELMAGEPSGKGITLSSSSTWKSLQQAVKRRHAQRVALARQAAQACQRNRSWPATFGRLECHGVTAEELTDEAELVFEGTLQDHCVGNEYYANRCASGMSIVARLTVPFLAQRATVEFVRNKPGQQPRWLIAQVAGPANSRVPQVFWTACRELQLKLP